MTADDADGIVDWVFSYPDGTEVNIMVGYTGNVQTATGILNHVQQNLANEFLTRLYQDGNEEAIALVDGYNNIVTVDEEENE